MTAPGSPPQLHLFSGKGGVGKTACATAWAMAASRAGQRVLLAELHGHDQAARLLAVEPTGYRITEVFDGLSLVDINPQDALHEYALILFKFEQLYPLIFENRVVRNFLRLVPSLGELVMLGKLWYHT